MAYELSGDALCLDLANTWGGRPDPTSDRLRSYEDLVRFSLQAGLIGDDEADALLAAANDEPTLTADILTEARELREAIYHVFSARAHDRAIAEEDVAALNRSLERALPRLRLRAGGGCCRWEWSAPAEALDRILWPMVRSAAELLTGADVERIGECDAPTCSWLFLDRSRNRRRRWCDMATCGNRAKARRYYRRHR